MARHDSLRYAKYSVEESREPTAVEYQATTIDEKSPPRLMKYIAEGGSGEVSELCALGDGYEKTYTNDELARMHDELSKINPREDNSQLHKDYDTLMNMLEFCMQNA